MADDVIVLGRDAVGTIAESHGVRYYLTECCGASAKGCDGYVGCRACYTEIDPSLGGVPDRTMRIVHSVEKPADFAIRETLFGDDAWWVDVEVPIRWTETYGDGLPHDDWKARYLGATR